MLYVAAACALLLHPLASHAQPQDSLLARIHALENEVRVLKQAAEAKEKALDGQFANKTTELDNRLESMRLAFSEDFFWAKVFAVVGMFISLMRRAPAIAEKKLNEKFGELLQTACFYFGPGCVETQREVDKCFAFANARTRMYGNLMNALRYQKLLR